MGSIEYPNCDGRPIGEDTLHFDWIVRIEQNLEHVFRDDPCMFVANERATEPRLRAERYAAKLRELGIVPE
jgi:hypothetical protein